MSADLVIPMGDMEAVLKGRTLKGVRRRSDEHGKVAFIHLMFTDGSQFQFHAGDDETITACLINIVGTSIPVTHIAHRFTIPEHEVPEFVVALMSHDYELAEIRVTRWHTHAFPAYLLATAEAS